MKRIFIFLVLFITVNLFCSENRVGFVVYGSLRNISKEGFERILKSKEVEYVTTQESAGSVNETAKIRYEKLKKAGKKIILDIWWGPSGKYNWDKYNFPDIAQNKKLRNEFFKEVIDKVINEIGVENLYGVHMLEETGSWYGYEKTVHPYYKLPDINTPNIRKYNYLFKKDTGLDMDLSPIWKPEEKFVFWRWASRTISSAAAHKVFCQHIHKTFPSLKAFQFEGYPDVARQCFTEYKVMLGYFDGIFTDNYSSPKNTYLLVGYRTMAPEAEIITLVAGHLVTKGDEKEILKVKKERLKYAYLAGMNGIGFFEPDNVKIKKMDFEIPKVWKQNLEIFKSFYNKPVYKKKRELLITTTNICVGGRGIDGYLRYTKLFNYAFVPAAEFRLINPFDYKAIIIFGPDYFGKNATWNQEYMKKKYNVDALFDVNLLNDFVRKGGLLIISGMPLEEKSGFYFTDNNILKGDKVKKEDFIKPNKFGQEKFGLKSVYSKIFPLYTFDYNVSEKAINLGENTGFVVPYGEGYFLILPQKVSGRAKVKLEERKNYGKFLTDVFNGFFRFTGRKELLKYFDD